MERHQLSENFYLDEFTRSQTAVRHGIDNSVAIGGVIYGRIHRLCNDILQPIRDQIGAAITVSSGYRSRALNKKIGGATTSQHQDGLAADITAAGITPMQLAEDIMGRVDYDQLILEFGEWVHISAPLRRGQARRQVLTAVKVPRLIGKPKTVYITGLHTQESALAIARLSA